MAQRVTCDGCSQEILPNEREFLRARVDETTLKGTSHRDLDFHGLGCLRRWVVDQETSRAQASAVGLVEAVI